MPYQPERIKEFVEWISKLQSQTGGRFGWFGSETDGLAVMLTVLEETESRKVKFLNMGFHTYVLPFISNRMALWDLEVWFEGQDPGGLPRYRSFSAVEFLEYATHQQRRLYEQYLRNWRRSRIFEECSFYYICIFILSPVTSLFEQMRHM